MNRSILQDLDRMINKEHLIRNLENRASHTISSVFSLLESIEELFDEQSCDELSKKLVGAIKLKDSSKFIKAIQKLQMVSNQLEVGTNSTNNIVE